MNTPSFVAFIDMNPHVESYSTKVQLRLYKEWIKNTSVKLLAFLN